MFVFTFKYHTLTDNNSIYVLCAACKSKTGDLFPKRQRSSRRADVAAPARRGISVIFPNKFVDAFPQLPQCGAGDVPSLYIVQTGADRVILHRHRIHRSDTARDGTGLGKQARARLHQLEGDGRLIEVYEAYLHVVLEAQQLVDLVALTVRQRRILLRAGKEKRFVVQQREHILCDPLTLRQRMSVRNAQCERVQLKQLFHDEIGGGELTVFNGLIVTEQQSRQNSTKRSSFSANTHFGHRAVSNLPTASVKIPVPANLFAGTSSNSRTGNNESAATQQPTAPLHDSEVTAASFLSLEASSDVQATYWFEMRASTGGSRNILDLSSSAKLQSGTHPNVENGSIPGSVAFFGLDPMARDVEKNVTIVYNGISYYPSTIKFAPNNASWRIQLKGDAETGDESLSQYGKTDFAYHILVFHRVTSDHYILETMAESELDALKANSEFWATNGINKSSKAFGKIRIG